MNLIPQRPDQSGRDSGFIWPLKETIFQHDITARPKSAIFTPTRDDQRLMGTPPPPSHAINIIKTTAKNTYNKMATQPLLPRGRGGGGEGERTYQLNRKGEYCARYNSNILLGTAIHTSVKLFTIAIVMRFTHLSVLMVDGGNGWSLRVCRVQGNNYQNI